MLSTHWWPTSEPGCSARQMPDDGSVTWRELQRDASRVVGMQEARWIVERVSGYNTAELLANDHERVSNRAVAYFDQLIARRVGGEPIQYVLGRWGFRSLDLYVDHRVLIPRPETEVVAGVAVDHLRAFKGNRIAVDLGTGSGAIALSLATEVGDALVVATDVSADALAVARANTAGIGGRVATRITLLEGSWFSALPSDLAGRVAVLVSNPPYVGIEDELDPAVREWEPHSALFAPEEGRGHLRELISSAPTWLAQGGALVLEMAPHQTQWAAEQADACGLHDVRIVSDLAGRLRVLVAVC